MFSMFKIPNLFTASNMLCGILAIILSVSGRIDLAPFAIYLGAIFDFFDGFLARKMKVSGELGKQLDSLADMVTFGLAPGIMMLVLLTYTVVDTSFFLNDLPFDRQMNVSFQTWMSQLISFKGFSWLPFCALIIPFFSLFRLAKFNIDKRQSDSFIGLNTPANTIFFTSFPLILASNFNENTFESRLIHSLIEPSFLIPLIVFMSILLISEIPFFSLKFKTFDWKNNQIRYLFLFICLILIPTVYVWSVPFIIILYIFLSIIESLVKKKSKNEI
jgi:CDP-diacylglycerol---serine O-phosphatidyltransferase